ncbi:phytochelatin synthase family protein [Nostoc sp. CENA67]|uniref:glutathione gamma-glutamylcysteinyltransferase n=1 Tax=Amazonocrinis nigriterrae CENA67 TaxID=2794033 RepID=A0A8J7HRD5_9NOST|nr:phytochelatin synthase family protein [Amazonocrinis nigriterrae]MBH8562650.1 phytochelatin synthase family protein [Amazonocrinis nigriterrae CENA67]
MGDNRSFQQQATKVKHPVNGVKGRVRQIAAVIASISGLLGVSGVAAVGYYAFVPPPIKQLPLPQNLISLESPLGKKILNSSNIKQDYTPLITYLETQKRFAYCGVASGVTVLNALGKGESRYKRLDQESFFDDPAQSVRSPYLVTFFGMTLDELAALVQSHNRKVEVHHTSSSTLEEFRHQAKANLKNNQDFIIVNYDRSQIGQNGGGHISPIAAYSEKMDKFLILDVSTYKYPPVWVSASTLWNAMNTFDAASKQTRGYLIVKK